MISRFSLVMTSLIYILDIDIYVRFSEGSIKGLQLIFSFPTVLFLYIILLWYQMAKKKGYTNEGTSKGYYTSKCCNLLALGALFVPEAALNKHFVAFSYTVYCGLQKSFMFSTLWRLHNYTCSFNIVWCLCIYLFLFFPLLVTNDACDI